MILWLFSMSHAAEASLLADTVGGNPTTTVQLKLSGERLDYSRD